MCPVCEDDEEEDEGEAQPRPPPPPPRQQPFHFASGCFAACCTADRPPQLGEGNEDEDDADDEDDEALPLDASQPMGPSLPSEPDETGLYQGTLVIISGLKHMTEYNDCVGNAVRWFDEMQACHRRSKRGPWLRAAPIEPKPWLPACRSAMAPLCSPR